MKFYQRHGEFCTAKRVRCDATLQKSSLEGTADAATAASRLGLPHNPMRVIAVQAFIGADRDAALLVAFERATTGFGWSRPGRSALAGNTV